MTLESSVDDQLRAPCLKPGDRVGLVSPSGRPQKPSVLNRCLKLIEEMDFKPVPGKHVLACSGHMAGTDEQRLSDLNGFLSDDSIQAIFCTTGGSGALHLLDRLDYGAILTHPKILLGGDENGCIGLAANTTCKLVSFIGPNLDEIQSKECFDRVKLAVTSASPIAPISAVSTECGDVPITSIYSPMGGYVSGRLVGGNLTAMSALMGTSFQPDLENAILFLNDRDERTDILERWFTGMWVAGILDKVQGVAFGSFDNCGTKGSFNLFSVEEQLADRLIQMRKPCCFDFPIASWRNALPVPIGLRATLDASSGQLLFHEAAVL